jgi:hypothetical protein
MTMEHRENNNEQAETKIFCNEITSALSESARHNLGLNQSPGSEDACSCLTYTTIIIIIILLFFLFISPLLVL